MSRAETELAEQWLDWYFDRLQDHEWVLYLFVVSVIWAFISEPSLKLIGFAPKTPLRLALIKGGPMLLLCLLFVPIIVLLALILVGPMLWWMLDPRHLWPSLPIVAVVWLTSYFSREQWRNVLAKSLQPWLIGMLIAEAIFQSTGRWLPQSQWDKLFWLEKASSVCEVTLEKLSPYPLLVNLLLLGAVFAVNVWHPELKTWTRRFETTRSFVKSAVSVLAVFTSVTLFGTGQVAALHELTAREKYDRLKDEAAARAQLILAARVTEDPKGEAADTKAFLDVVHRNVLVDRAVPARLDDFDYDPSMPKNFRSKEWAQWSKEKDRQQLERMVRTHAKELLKWADNNLMVRNAAAAVDNASFKAMLDRKFTDDERKDAKDRFDKALDGFIDKAAEISAHPLTEMLKTAGLPDLSISIVKDLYGAQLERLTKEIVDPIADALFRPKSSEAEVATVALARASQRPVFDEKALPPRIATPTVADRIVEQQERMIIEKTVRETVREAR